MADAERPGGQSDALAGVTVVVTRQGDDRHELAALLRERGARIIAVPLIQVDRLDSSAAIDQMVGSLTTEDWVVVSSVNAADVLAASAAFGASRAHVAAVGIATARRLPRVDLVPARSNAAGVVEAMPAGHGRVVVLQAQGGSPTLVDGLSAKGWQVRRIDTHVARPVVPDAAQQLTLLAADAVVFTSGSQARAWAAVLGSATPPVVVAIGPQTAQDAAAVGIETSAVAQDHSLRGVVAALEGALAR